MTAKTRLLGLGSLVVLVSLLGWSLTCWAGAAATPVSPAENPAQKPAHEQLDRAKALGDLVDFAAALAAGGDYLRHAQADITEDNAGNGTDGVDETPDDPDDGGWDWRLTDPDYTHSTGASPTNLYGATAQGLYHAYLASGDAGLFTALTDAANGVLADTDIDSGPDFPFLMLYNDLPGVAGTAYEDTAKVRFDRKIAAYNGADSLAIFIRDMRNSQGYPNGIIPWDIAPWVKTAAMLEARFPGDPNDYAQWAIDMAEVVWEDSFNDNPGYFDIIDDQGFDPLYGDANFWWYNLGITGLIDSFDAAGVHIAEIPGLVTILLDGQHPNGGIDDSYGVNPDNEDWQATGYAAMCLASLDQATYQYEISKMAYFLGATQDGASGGWVYGSGNHYPEIGGECTAGLSYGIAPTDVLVDDDFTSQADVDVYNTANATSYTYGYDAFGNVQDGIDAVSGSTVTILAGTYTEQIHITLDDLILVGAGVDVTIIKSPATLTEYFTTSNDNYPVVFVDEATGVSISDLTVDGDSQGNANYRFYGIAFWNGGGSLADVKVINVMDSPFSGAQHGVGVYAYNDTGGPYSIVMNEVLVDDYQKTGVALSGTGLTVDLDDVTTIGEGPTSVTAQNGIQISYGAGGTADNCDISDVAYTGGTWTATGLLIYEGMIITATGVDVDGCQTSIYWIDGDGTYDGGTVTNPLGDAYYGYSTGAKSGADPRLPAQPFGDSGRGGGRATIDVTVSNSTFTGTGLADSWGVSGWGYGPITFTVTDCTVTNWDWGVVAYDFGGATFDTDVHYCDINGNTSYGMYSNASTQANASCNWWGDIGGPDYPPFNPNPAGDAVSSGIKFWPWLDGIGGICNQYGGDNIAAEDPTECITPSNTCVTVPVIFNRTDTTPSRGVSVTFQLSSELVLCTPDPPTDITMATGVGSWSEGFGNLNHQIVDNGGGSYTVDRAILGIPCGPTGGGYLFYVEVAKAPSVTTDAIGTVTVTDVIVRDCNNAPLPGIPGAPASVTIDLTSPAVLADLTATQVKTGNDSDGTTEITLAWTAPGGDADFIEVYRKGYGDYPEYDDGTGAVPGPPVTTGNGWTLVTTLAATATGYVDEPSTRDFWYYSAYVTDLCGNVSSAAGIVGGVLNYHLGDVHDTATPGAGDNLVNTSDISHLGFNYGITVPLYGALNYLDVGPTTDYSVDALPTTDDQVQFEDLMMFAINYGQVSKDLPVLTPAVRNAITIVVGAPGEVGSTFEVTLHLTGDGQMQGLSVPLRWNNAKVEPIGMSAGDLLGRQGGQSLVLTPAPGTVDAALFGVRGTGICGEGELATVSFKVKAAGDPGIAPGEIIARDAENHEVPFETIISEDGPSSLPRHTVLNSSVPNPFNPSTQLSFVLARGGNVTLRIYSLRGHLVRTMLDEELQAGPHSVEWDGKDASGQEVSSGSYLVRLVAPDRTRSQQITMIK